MDQFQPILPTSVKHRQSKEKEETRIRLTKGFPGREMRGEHPKIKHGATAPSLDSASPSEKLLSNGQS